MIVLSIGSISNISDVKKILTGSVDHQINCPCPKRESELTWANLYISPKPHFTPAGTRGLREIYTSFFTMVAQQWTDLTMH